MVKDDPLLVMPDVSPYDYMVSEWHNAGMFKTGAMSLVPLEWIDIASYAQFNQVSEWEASMIIEMSRSYVVGRNIERNTPPYQREFTEEEAIARANSLIMQEDMAIIEKKQTKKGAK